MNSKKLALGKKQRWNKTKKNIKKLFESLRKDSIDSFDNCSVISLDDTQNTVIFQNNTESLTSTKRKLSQIEHSPKCVKKRDSLIIIKDNDDELVSNDQPCQSTPKRKAASQIYCSTPIPKKNSTSLQDLISDNFNRTSSSTKQNKDNVLNLTKEINPDSFLTIDLTNETVQSGIAKNESTVVDLASDTQDCTVVSVSNANFSMSGDSDVTVLANQNKRKNKHMKKLADGIANLNTSEKGRLLELITQKIFSGCKPTLPSGVKNSLANIREAVSCGTETVEDTYIKTVILGSSLSRNSVGSNVYQPDRTKKIRTGLRMIIIDGSNVAMEHSKGRVFSVKGLNICIDYFVRRGHVVKAFVPRFRCKFGKSTEPRLLDSLERQGLVVYTPSREIHGKNITPYDDRYIIQCAAEFDGVIVTGDNYRDLAHENPKWRYVIENRLLPFTWVEDMIMFPRDPLGRNGPTLEQFLKHPSVDSNKIIL